MSTLAFREGPPRTGSAEATWRAARSNGRFSQDHEEGRLARLPFFVPRLRRTGGGNFGQDIQEDGPSAGRPLGSIKYWRVVNG